ncbi:unnamed protein product [Ectocarpus sp. CCAP 1310/34]|nr:unnamed protein product [Ectocarpus sp. CCAP 1310/34]
MSDDPQVSGDSHMVGLLGQEIDWYGEDSGWYCLLVNSEFQVNARVTAPMPDEFPTRQLVSGVSIRSAEGPSLVVEVKNPITTETEGCSSTSAPCLAEGALRILVDGDESHALQSPVENLVLPGGDLVVSSANLPAECRPFGGDRIWAAQFAAMNDASGRRSLRGHTPFADWVLEADTMAAPGWCALFAREQRLSGLSSVQSNRAILRVETGGVTVRVDVGVNYQDSVLSSDGNAVLVPELDFWQTDIAFEELRPSGELGGMLGDTARYVIDDDGKPITSGMEALRGPVETCRVSGPLGVDFEQMHGAVEQGNVFA